MLECQSLNRKRSGIRNVFGRTCTDVYCPEYQLSSPEIFRLSVYVKWQIMVGWFLMPHETSNEDQHSVGSVRVTSGAVFVYWGTTDGTALSPQNKPTILNIRTRGRMSTTGCTELLEPNFNTVPWWLSANHGSWSNNYERHEESVSPSNLLRLGLRLHASSLSWRVVMEILGVGFALRAQRWTGWHRSCFLF
jgi:hypothetical protein